VNSALLTGPHFLQVMTGAERFAICGNDDNAHIMITINFVERALQGVEHGAGQGVVLRRAIQCQGDNTLFLGT
jgi:hypothetical protein